jgi:hypothetical protein
MAVRSIAIIAHYYYKCRKSVPVLSGNGPRMTSGLLVIQGKSMSGLRSYVVASLSNSFIPRSQRFRNEDC